MSLVRKISRLPERVPQLLSYFYYHKLLFGITNTKFNISFTVFRESFLGDQYQLKTFSQTLDGSESLLFVDIGRNHGFVFYYFLHHLAKTNIRIKRIQYIGIDPSPIKFAYFDTPLSGTEVHYRLIDKAVVFDDSETIHLKYGERNLGNFNVAGSNYETSMNETAKRRQFIEIEVETLNIGEVEELVGQAMDYDAAIVKIDCKNRTEIIMEKTLERLKEHGGKWLVACERDRSSEGRLDGRVQNLGQTLVATS